MTAAEIAAAQAEFLQNAYWNGNWKRDNPNLHTAITAYLGGGPRPPDTPNHYGQGMILLEDYRRALEPPPPGELLKPRPVLSNPVFLTLPQTGPININLDPLRDYEIKVGDRRRAVELIGGRSILIVGGKITPNMQSADPNEWRALILTNNGPIVHIEGLAYGKTSRALAIRSKNTIVHWQNIHVEELTGDYNRDHIDGVQTWDGPKEMWVDKVTAPRGNGAKGFLWMTDRPVGTPAPNTTPPGFVHQQRVNFPKAGRYQYFTWDADVLRSTGKDNYVDQADFGPGHRYGLQDGWGNPNVFANGQHAGHQFIPYSIFHQGTEYRCNTLAQHNSAPFNGGPVGRTNGDRMIKHDPRFAGQEWTMGAPPGGDFVKPSDVGLGYV